MPDGRTYKHHKYDEIIKEQVIISYLSKGAISVQELDEMSPYDRKLISDTLKEIKDAEMPANNKAFRKNPKSRTSRF